MKIFWEGEYPKLMYLKCAHPGCTSDFDYAHGRLIRFQQTPAHEKQPAHWHSVKHYWLCARCCETYTIEYRKGLGVVLMQRIDALSPSRPSHFILQSEVPVNPPSIRRRMRRTVRERKRPDDKSVAPTITIEILENRNLERRG